MRRRQRQTHDVPLGSPPWMMTYGDMVTQILAFFILLYSYSTLDLQKYKAAMASVSQALGVLPGGTSILQGPLVGSEETGVAEPPGVPEAPESGPGELETLAAQVRAALEKTGFGGRFELVPGEDSLVVRFPDTVLFDSGQAELRPDSLPALDAVAEVLRQVPNRVRVEGHTDTDPISNFRFPSNWELSTARAGRVVRYFVDTYGLDPRRFESAGLGEYRPVAPNDTPENKQKNRRVDIVILSSRPAGQAGPATPNR